MTVALADQQQRLQALDTKQSFIVQAPAGSGKTELLSQRFLALLAQVTQPEEIIALTFTRKAAAEMRERIIKTIRYAATNERPNNEHEQRSYDLATAVLAHDQQQQWDLLQNPNRLRIYTIDALCAKLVKQMPLSTEFITQANISDDAERLYQQAARALLMDLDETQPWYEALSHLLLHLDNRQWQVEELFIQMLAKRDQWLPYIFAAKNIDNLRKQLQLGLQHSNQDILAELGRYIPAELNQELLLLLLYAANNVDDSCELSILRELKQLPPCDVDHKSSWLIIANFLLTKADRQWRKQVTKAQGFPAASSIKDKTQQQFAKDAKQRMLALLTQLNEHESFRLQLCQLLDSPPLYYDDQQWLIVNALLELLPYLAAQLNLVFQQQNTVDFIEIANHALQALGQFEQPSELALQLDYQIKHLLVDEFQDTSTTQYRLLEHLTAGWQAGDGRSLFLVGDPMQSIYRFREAQVGLFLQAQQFGLTNVALTSLQLSANFRSQQTIIDWVNTTFANIFPRYAHPASGAVPYHAAQVTHAAQVNSQVGLYACADDDDEAQQVVQLIQSAQQQNSKQSIAILVAARSHLIAIITQLKTANIAYHALELDSLATSMVVSDLWSLTKALLFTNDRLAWLACLRAPWCGLTLNDLHRVAATHLPSTLLENINNKTLVAQLSHDGQIRLQRFSAVINIAFANRGRLSLREWIEKTWLALGGPACLSKVNQLDDADYFFKELEKYPSNPYQFDCSAFEGRLQRLYADNYSMAENPVQVMTIHKAKGLEFDVVILPGLHRQTRQKQTQLMLWEERTGEKGQHDLLIAPIKAAEFERDPIYNYLKLQEQRKDQHEQARLLYVAATRAKAQLYLLACINYDEQGALKAPSKRSLLHHLWPLHHAAFADIAQVGNSHHHTNSLSTRKRYHLSHHWRNNYTCAVLLPHAHGHNPSHSPEYRWQANFARQSGTIIHAYLQRMSSLAQQDWPTLLTSDEQQQWRWQLCELGVAQHALASCCQVIKEALQNIMADTQAQWLLKKHHDAHSEWALSAVINNQVQQLVIDRSFVDENGIRWIIDYKTATPQQQTLDEFVAMQQQHYTQQLQTYALALSSYEQRPINLALYFPLCKILHSWPYQQSKL